MQVLPYSNKFPVEDPQGAYNARMLLKMVGVEEGQVKTLLDYVLELSEAFGKAAVSAREDPQLGWVIQTSFLDLQDTAIADQRLRRFAETTSNSLRRYTQAVFYWTLDIYNVPLWIYYRTEPSYSGLIRYSCGRSLYKEAADEYHYR